MAPLVWPEASAPPRGRSIWLALDAKFSYHLRDLAVWTRRGAGYRHQRFPRRLVQHGPVIWDGKHFSPYAQAPPRRGDRRADMARNSLVINCDIYETRVALIEEG